jgi:hypothetical protein
MGADRSHPVRRDPDKKNTTSDWTCAQGDRHTRHMTHAQTHEAQISRPMQGKRQGYQATCTCGHIVLGIKPVKVEALMERHLREYKIKP